MENVEKMVFSGEKKKEKEKGAYLINPTYKNINAQLYIFEFD